MFAPTASVAIGRCNASESGDDERRVLNRKNSLEFVGEPIAGEATDGLSILGSLTMHLPPSCCKSTAASVSTQLLVNFRLRTQTGFCVCSTSETPPIAFE